MPPATAGQTVGQRAPGVDIALGAGLDGQPGVATEGTKDHGQAGSFIRQAHSGPGKVVTGQTGDQSVPAEDRKSTRLNSSHVRISYAVFCLKKKTEAEQ